MKNFTCDHTKCPRCKSSQIKIINPERYMFTAIICGFFFFTLFIAIAGKIISWRFDMLNIGNWIIVGAAIFFFFPFKKNLTEHKFMKTHNIKMYIRCSCSLDKIPIFD